MSTRIGDYSVNTLRELLKIRGQLQQKLARNSDYRALTAIEHAIAELNGELIASPKPADLCGTAIRPYRSGSHAEAVSQILSERGQPLAMRELLARLRQRGVAFNGRNPKFSLSATLSRSHQFRSVTFEGARCWWFSDRSIPDHRRPPDVKHDMRRLAH